MGTEAVRRELAALERLLAQHGETHPAQAVRTALDGSDQDLRAFLASNELWGGAGSIADQGGVSQGRDVRRSIEVVLIRLGLELRQQGTVNARTAMWVDAFSTWQRDGI
jgi:hypothetical protein